MTKTRKLVEMTILAALVVVLQLLGSYIKIGAVSISLVLIPIVIGGIMHGPVFGAVLGAIFGAITFWGGVSGADGFTNILIQYHPAATAVICFVKAIAAGAGSALVYRALRNRNKKAAVALAAASAPVLNTGIFIIGMLCIKDVLLNTAINPNGVGAFYYLFVLCAGVNFVVEFFVNIICSSAIYRIITNVSRRDI